MIVIDKKFIKANRPLSFTARERDFGVKRNQTRAWIGQRIACREIPADGAHVPDARLSDFAEGFVQKRVVLFHRGRKLDVAMARAGADAQTALSQRLIALDAEVTLTSSKGQRTLRLDEFFVDYYQTALEAGELLTEIHVPPSERPGWSHIKFTPRSIEDFATVGVAVTLKTNNGTCEDIRLGLNSVASTIVHAKKAEAVLRGKPITAAALREMAEVASTECEPTDDNRGSAEYKLDLIKVLVRRAAEEALQRAS